MKIIIIFFFINSILNQDVQIIGGQRADSVGDCNIFCSYCIPNPIPRNATQTTYQTNVCRRCAKLDIRYLYPNEMGNCSFPRDVILKECEISDTVVISLFSREYFCIPRPSFIDKNCLIYRPRYQACTFCNILSTPQYYLDGKICKPVTKRIDKCFGYSSDGLTCEECDKGYIYNKANDKCEINYVDCKKGYLENNKCIRCRYPNQYLSGGDKCIEYSSIFKFYLFIYILLQSF